jgi:hypothetical protein
VEGRKEIGAGVDAGEGRGLGWPASEEEHQRAAARRCRGDEMGESGRGRRLGRGWISSDFDFDFDFSGGWIFGSRTLLPLKFNPSCRIEPAIDGIRGSICSNATIVQKYVCKISN